MNESERQWIKKYRPPLIDAILVGPHTCEYEIKDYSSTFTCSALWDISSVQGEYPKM